MTWSCLFLSECGLPWEGKEASRKCEEENRWGEFEHKWFIETEQTSCLHGMTLNSPVHNPRSKESKDVIYENKYRECKYVMCLLRRWKMYSQTKSFKEYALFMLYYWWQCVKCWIQYMLHLTTKYKHTPSITPHPVTWHRYRTQNPTQSSYTGTSTSNHSTQSLYTDTAHHQIAPPSHIVQIHDMTPRPVIIYRHIKSFKPAWMA